MSSTEAALYRAVTRDIEVSVTPRFLEERSSPDRGQYFWAYTIEIVNRGHDWGYPEYPLRQVAAVIALCRGIVLRRNVPSHRVLAHSDVAPSRKKDPGEKFPWHSMANSGVGHWVQPAPIVRSEGIKLGTVSDAVRGLQQALARYGYGVPVTGKYDTATMEVVTAFQRHFRPAKVDGVADHSTLATLQSLLASLPAEATAVAAG